MLKLWKWSSTVGGFPICPIFWFNTTRVKNIKLWKIYRVGWGKDGPGMVQRTFCIRFRSGSLNITKLVLLPFVSTKCHLHQIINTQNYEFPLTRPNFNRFPFLSELLAAVVGEKLCCYFPSWWKSTKSSKNKMMAHRNQTTWSLILIWKLLFHLPLSNRLSSKWGARFQPEYACFIFLPRNSKS